LIKCRVKGTIRIADVGHVSSQEADIFREKWISPHYTSADAQPQHVRESLRMHLDNLMGKGSNKFSRQEFFKVLTILDTIAGFIQWLTHNLSNIRAIDLRKIKLIIDDQVKASLITLRSFVHYFLCQRSQNGLFICPPNSMHLLRDYIRKEGDQTFLDTIKLFDELIVEEKANLDDKYPELKIADLLSNFSRRTLSGDFGIRVAKKLEKILVAVNPICFDNHKDIKVILPTQNQDAINLLLAIKPF
jgi:hypothetical protein